VTCESTLTSIRTRLLSQHNVPKVDSFRLKVKPRKVLINIRDVWGHNWHNAHRICTFQVLLKNKIMKKKRMVTSTILNYESASRFIRPYRKYLHYSIFLFTQFVTTCFGAIYFQNILKWPNDENKIYLFTIHFVFLWLYFWSVLRENIQRITTI
jgi:hypothetical protein